MLPTYIPGTTYHTYAEGYIISIFEWLGCLDGWKYVVPLIVLPAGKDVGCRSNFAQSRLLYTQDTSFSVQEFLDGCLSKEFKPRQYFTGNHINQDPPCTQKPIYTPIFTHHMRSWLICGRGVDETNQLLSWVSVNRFNCFFILRGTIVIRTCDQH